MYIDSPSCGGADVASDTYIIRDRTRQESSVEDDDNDDDENEEKEQSNATSRHNHE